MKYLYSKEISFVRLQKTFRNGVSTIMNSIWLRPRYYEMKIENQNENQRFQQIFYVYYTRTYYVQFMTSMM